ncbi:MAG TPA: rRNA maturation RNase YbeY [Gammaproteobacteria bacterium]
MTPGALTVHVQTAYRGSPRPAAADIRRWARAAVADGAARALTVRIVGEEESAALNERYRGRPGPTNVLAFPADPAAAALEAGAAPLGDLVICAPVVAREAAEQGKALEAHWAHMVVHGALHLLGYDHMKAPDARRMERREREILAGLGFPDPY